MLAATEGAKRLRRKNPNIEDQVRAINELIGGLRILAGATDAGDGAEGLRPDAATALQEWKSALDATLAGLLQKLLATERDIAAALAAAQDHSSGQIRRLLGGFLLPFASRTATRERTHIFTTNYDRLIERGCDLLGLRVVDRFVGSLAPVFHSSRLGIDLHYNPPGIRGEPRYLEGVVRLTKLHGSVDWRSAAGPSGGLEVQRCGLPFGAADDHPDLPAEAGDKLLVYPNAAKDVETTEYPYAELFRDFAAAVCRPNAVVVTYGYGFGDDHVNRVLHDMLSIPSTHLVIISYDDADERLHAFHDRAGREAQITLLVGSHFGDLGTLIDHYLPKPAIDRTTWRMVDLLKGAALLHRGFFALFMGSFARGCVSPVAISGGTSSRPARTGVFSAASRASSRRRTPSVFSPTGRAPFWTFARRSGTVPWEGRQTCDGCDDRIPATYIRRAPNLRPLHRSPEASPVRSGRCCLRGCQSLPLVQRSPADERERTRTGTAPAGPGVGAQAPARTSRPTQPERGCWSGRGHQRCRVLGAARARKPRRNGLRHDAGCGSGLRAARSRRLASARCRAEPAAGALLGRDAPPRDHRDRPRGHHRVRPGSHRGTRHHPRGSGRRGVRCSSPAHRRACRHLVRDPMGDDRRSAAAGSRSLDAY